MFHGVLGEDGGLHFEAEGDHLYYCNKIPDEDAGYMLLEPQIKTVFNIPCPAW